MAKKKRKVKKIVQDVDAGTERVSLIERAKREKEETATAPGRKRDIARMAFALWLTIPARWRGAPDGVIDALGITDLDILDVIKLKTAQDFGVAFDVHGPTLSRWRQEIEEGEQGIDNRTFFKKLVREGLGALYRKLIEQGDAERFKTFAGYVEGWMPGINLKHSGSIDTLDEEERKALDKLLEKNSIKV